ncbi:hypothetical protein K0U27_01655 [archaeon]|nr:hypothetical protein [archaeon]
MVKSLGDFNIEKSSSSDKKNIVWSQKTPLDDDKPRKKNSHKTAGNTSATNIIYVETDEESSVKRVFVVEQPSNVNKKNKNPDRKFENSSASNCNIQQGFKRPSR